MKSFSLITCCFLLCLNVSVAQCLFENYAPKNSKIDEVNSENEKSILKQKYLENCKSIESKYKEKHIKILTKCYDEVNFGIDKNHYYFDNIINPFFQKIFNEIVSKNEDLKSKKLKFYVSKYSEPNAFCDANGIMIFNIGLLRYVENESQIAFIIAHELSHYLKRHNYVQNEKNFATLYSKQTKQAINDIKSDGYDMKSKLDKLLKKIAYGSSNHSRLLETDADTTGYNLLRNTKYNVALAPRIFDILDICDAEKYTDSIDLKQHFTFDGTAFNESWTYVEEEIINKKERFTKEEKDSLKTHPECNHRKKNIETLNQKNNVANVKFIKNLRVDSLRIIADFETLYNLNNFDNIGEAFYLNLKLIDKFPNNSFLHETLIDIMSKIENKLIEHRLSEVLSLPNPFDKGDYKIVNNFLNNIQLSEIRELKMNYCKKYINTCPNNSGFYLFALKKAEEQKDPETINWIKNKHQTQFNKPINQN